jgi:predicted amino acid racemase
MKYPALITNKTKLAENINTIQKLCAEMPISFCAVTKCFCAAPEIVDTYYKSGVREFADTRIPNLKRIDYPDARRWLLRLPMLSEVEDVVKYSDISLNSEVKTVAALSEASIKLGKTHKIILMIDVGDLREGVLAEKAVETAGEMLKYKGVEFYGIGVNFNCFGGIIPNQENVAIAVNAAREISEKFGVDIPVISGGNSGSMHLLTGRTMPTEVNYLRLGEVVFFGRETSYQQLIGNMHEDIFRLETQIIELQKKPSMPIGEAGLNAFGEKVTFVDKGDMLRAIVACGRQDVDMDKIKPLDNKAEILGQSSDHMIIDVTHSDKKYEVGDIISFSISYGSLLSLSTSEYVHKVYE